jgi:hypothetical protein
MDWLALRNVTEVRYFMGLVGYYRRFIKGFSKISNPITSFQRKGKKIVWSQECKATFQQLKYVLTNSLVLKIVDPGKKFFVCIDACKEALRGVLMQEGKLIIYESQKLNEREKKYVTHDLELATIVQALQMWRHYLLERRFILMTYHCSLKYLVYQRRLNSR